MRGLVGGSSPGLMFRTVDPVCHDEPWGLVSKWSGRSWSQRLVVWSLALPMIIEEGLCIGKQKNALGPFADPGLVAMTGTVIDSGMQMRKIVTLAPRGPLCSVQLL